jgi:hypothetical protein
MALTAHLGSVVAPPALVPPALVPLGETELWQGRDLIGFSSGIEGAATS